MAAWTHCTGGGLGANSAPQPTRMILAMRWFWIAVVALLLAAVAAVAWKPRAGGAPPPPPGPTTSATAPPTDSPPPPEPARPISSPQPAAQPTIPPVQQSLAESESTPPPAPHAPAATTETPADAALLTGPPAPPLKSEAAPDPNPLDALAGAAGELPKAPAPADSVPAEPPTSAPDGTQPPPFAFPDDPAFGPDRWVDSKAVRRADGAVLLDDRFVVRGSGTAEDPYRVTWELLASAQEVYKPRAGQKKLPRRVTFLHNKYVRITGFVAFPIASNNPRECLVMLNQWDGCCIGIPPTAFDAVEVRLKKAATGEQRLLEHGELQGKFKVDPFEDGGWLLSLYLLDDATLKGDH